MTSDVKSELNFLPTDVNLSSNLCSTFGKSEIEYSAIHLIEHLVAIDSKNWRFTFSGLFWHYQSIQADVNTMLFGLMGSWVDDGPWLIQEDPGYIVHWGTDLQVTHHFLKRISKHVRVKIH